MSKSVDVVIVGQGIAGTTLAFELLAQGLTILIIDDNYKHSSSIVAAGVVNPIVFKRLTKSWNVDVLLPVMHDFFNKVEQNLNVKIVNPLEILKLFSSIKEENQWIEKSDAIGFDVHLGETLSQIEVETNYELKAPFGGGVVKSSCYIDLPSFLNQSKTYFKSEEAYFEHSFDFEKLSIANKRYLDVTFDKIVFCEGYKAVENPFFKDLPFNLAKGEVIEFKHSSLTLDRLINKNGFVLPTKQKTFKLGATYEWKELNQKPTQKGAEILLEKLTFLKNESVEIINHMAGVRPTVKDRRPLIGKHETEDVYIFNGLGTKGALIAPYYATQMSKFIANGIYLDSEVDIKRFSTVQ